MHHPGFQQIEEGATVLTGSERLARVLMKEFTAFQRDRGKAVWRTPRIFSLTGWLRSCWRDWVLESGEGEAPLSPAQEAALWEEIVGASPQGRTLLRVPETAVSAMDAWGLAQAYRVPFRREEFALTEDCEAFFGWAEEFAGRLEENGWGDSARLCDRVAESIRAGRIERPFPLFLAGFDDVTPQMRDLFDALCGGVEWQLEKTNSPSRFRAGGLHDAEAEVWAAAEWARSILETNPASQIGIVVPDLNSSRSKVARIFREVLQPGDPEPGERAFHISMGGALREEPAVDAALRLLGLCAGPQPTDSVGLLLRSPFWKGGRHALFDAYLRRKAGTEADIGEIRGFAEKVHPGLYRVLGALEKEVRKTPAEQSASQWGRTFSRLLKIAGWPGERALSSRQHQAVNAWNALLSMLASIDSITGRMGMGGALARLRTLGGRQRFQPEDTGAPVQAMGLLEASGLRFDHLWVMGLHDEAVPPPARPNPFLPLAAQRRLGTPHSSAERELEFNRKLLNRLRVSAGNVVFSYPQWDGAQGLGPSPLLGDRLDDLDGLAKPRFFMGMAGLEGISDGSGPGLEEGERSGGTSLVKDMAACPFRAFAVHRLGARPLENPVLGLDPRQRGTGVHEALRAFWDEVKTHAALANLSERELAGAIGRAADAGAGDAAVLGRELERTRLRGLLAEWMEVERRRPPFTVALREHEDKIPVGGLTIKARIDRVDELAGGGRVIVDYKTGEVSASAWTGERLDEPQVPLYCLCNSDSISAAVFAQVRTGKMKYQGVSQCGEAGAIGEMKLPRGVAMDERIEDWRSAVEKLAADFRAGDARVDPKESKSCDYCRVKPFCRIAEAAGD